MPADALVDLNHVGGHVLSRCLALHVQIATASFDLDTIFTVRSLDVSSARCKANRWVTSSSSLVCLVCDQIVAPLARSFIACEFSRRSDRFKGRLSLRRSSLRL